MVLAMMGHDTVIHTAALKYIPEGEANPWECIRVNIDGSRYVMDCAREAGVSTCVMISTDKAPQPLNTYGMTKALVERLVQGEADAHAGPKYVACRYGNVIGSTGSIWPVWTQQAKVDKCLKLTNPYMTRYFMTIHEAVDTISYAVNSGMRSAVVIPQPRAQAIGKLITHIGALWGIPIEDVGKRPGEKLHEQMISGAELDRLLEFGDYYQLVPPTHRVENPPKAENTKLLSSQSPVDWISPDEFMQAGIESESV
jgi:UDP-N-acetylglucosamine 4,6-dehydratase